MIKIKEFRPYIVNTAKCSYYFLTSIFLGVYLLITLSSDSALRFLFPSFASELIKENISSNKTISIFVVIYVIWNISTGIYELLSSLEEVTKNKINQKRLKSILAVAIFVIYCFLIKMEILLYCFIFLSLYFLYRQVGIKSIVPTIISSTYWFISIQVFEFLTRFYKNSLITGTGYLFFQLSLWIYSIVLCTLIATRFGKKEVGGYKKVN